MAHIDELPRQAVSLPKVQRLALARALLDLEPACGVAEVEQSWDEEIRARIKAVDEGRGTGITYDDLRREMDPRHDAR
jgi:putative addiction module component (TIGR02574 family)